MFALSFVLSWLLFAVVWWLIAVTHGDLEEMHLPSVQGNNNLFEFIFFLPHLTIDSNRQNE